jgi:cytoskeletal protein RodZ
MTVGETLRRERVKRKLNLDQISSELKISPRFLEAIEDEAFDKLPGGVFVRAFVRQYGSFLGLNGEELAAQLRQSIEPPAIGPVEPPHLVRTGASPIQVPRMDEWQSVGDHRFRWSGPLSAAIMVVVVMLICSGVYAWLQRPRNPVSAHNSPAPAQAAVPAATQPAAAPVTTATAPPTVPEPEKKQEAPSEPAQAAVTPPGPVVKTEIAPPQPNPDATVRLEITADEPVWILARGDGKFLFTGTMEPHQTRTVEAVRDVVLRLGNAGGVTITLNGKPVGAVGPKGQARTVQFTSGGFQIVPAAKPVSDPAALALPIARL